MPVNKTLYVRDEDAKVWEDAREIVGDKLSAFLSAYLRSVVQERKATASGFERIVIKYLDVDDRPRNQSFLGRWIISPEENWGDGWALATTAKGNIAAFSFVEERTEQGYYNYGSLHVFDSFESAMAETDNVLGMPKALITEALLRVGTTVEELDI